LRQWNKNFVITGMGLIIPVSIVILWHIFSVSGLIATNIMPSPLKIVSTIVDLFREGELLEHIGITLYRVSMGFLLGTAIALLFGVLNGYFRTIRYLLDPLIQALRNIPSLAWVPLFILWMGIGEASKISLIALGVFFPVYLNLVSGIQGVDRRLLEVGWVHGYQGWRLIRHFFLPSALPSFFVGLRSGLGLGWMFVVAAEIMGASKGLGFLLTDGQTTGRPAIIIASILLFALLGKLTDYLLELAGRRILRWQDSYESLERRKAL
jgi:sulfonate transport system permease protein